MGDIMQSNTEFHYIDTSSGLFDSGGKHISNEHYW